MYCDGTCRKRWFSSINFFLFRALSRKSTKTAKISTNLKFGQLEEASLRVSKPFTQPKSSIEIWNQPTFSLGKITFQKSATWMFRSLWTRILPTPKQALLTMPVQRFGTMTPIVMSATSGPLDACFMRCALSNLHSREKTWMRFMKKFSDASTKKSRNDTPLNCKKLFRCASGQDTEGQTSASWWGCSKNFKPQNPVLSGSH